MPAIATDPTLAFVLSRPFPEQVAFFRAKLGNLLPTATWLDVQKYQHDRGFMVAGAAKADLLADLAAAVDAAIAQGETLQAFRTRFAAIVAKHGWTGWTGEATAAGRAWRTRVIYQTNLSTSYAAGRLAQLKDAAYPLWVYRHSEAVHHPRPEHQAWNGLTLPADHPFWLSHYPPNGWGCRCRVLGSRGDAQTRRLGGNPDYNTPPTGWDSVQSNTGEPAGIDKGWGYMPGGSVYREMKDFVDTKVIKLDAPIGAAMAEVLNPVLLKETAESFVKFVDKTLLLPTPRNELMVVGAIKPLWIQKAAELDVIPSSANISVLDKDIWHTFRDTKANQLELDWYKELPYHLDAPRAVILDTTHDEPAFLLIFDGKEKSRKLVVQINYKVKKVGLRNIVETGKFVDVSGIRAMMGNGYTLIEGSL